MQPLFIFLPATNQELKRALNPQRATTDFGMADFRFKGYVNDFMVSPRNPITLQSSHQMAGEFLLVYPYTVYWDQCECEQLTLNRFITSHYFRVYSALFIKHHISIKPTGYQYKYCLY